MKRLFVTAYMRYLPNMWLPIGNNAQVLDAMLCEMLGQRLPVDSVRFGNATLAGDLTTSTAQAQVDNAPLCRLRASDFPCLLSRQNQIQPPSLQQQHHFRAASQGASLTSRLLCSSDSFVPAIVRSSFADNIPAIARSSFAPAIARSSFGVNVASIDFPLHVSGRRILYEAFSAEFRSR